MKKMPHTDFSKSTHMDASLDEALMESFPASDPVAISFPRAVEIGPNEPAAARTGAEKRKLSKSGRQKKNHDIMSPSGDKRGKNREIELHKHMTVEDGLKTIMTDCMMQIQGNGVVLIDGSNSEGLHQMRVGLRRLQSVLELFKDFASLPVAVQEELNWLSSKLGPARDWEILSRTTLTMIAASAPDDVNIALLQHAAIGIACEKREQAISVMRSVRFTRLLLTIADWLERGPWHSPVDKSGRHKLDASLPNFAEKCLIHEQHHLFRYGKNLRGANPEVCHKIRIAAKKMRYKTEFFRFLYPKKKIENYINSLAALQDELGCMNDRVVADRMLQQLAVGRPDLHSGIGFARGYLISTGGGKEGKSWKRFVSTKLPTRK